MAFECSGKAFIKVYRKFLEWEWYSDVNTSRLFIHCLLKANWKPAKWKGQTIESGQFVTSLASLSKETQLTVQQVRTALEHLASTGEITNKSQSKYRIITVNNWNCYQDDNRVDNKQVTNNQQTSNKQVTTIEERKNIRKEEEKIINNNNINKYPSSFEEFWNNYPRKQDKGQAYKCYKARLNDGYSEEQLLTACINYAAECDKDKREKKYIKVASTFLSVNEPFVEYLDERRNEDDSVAGRTREDEDEYYAEIDKYLESDDFKHADEKFTLPFV